MNGRSNVFLVGPMGAGKSTIGRLLAADLGLEFRDTDKEIEDRSGVDIAWIFDKEGEEGFRLREAAMIAELSLIQGAVIATGGGAILREDNRRTMINSGRVVYLKTSIDEQVRRTSRDTKRPLLQNADPEAVLRRLMSERDALYQSVADIVIDTNGRSPKSVAAEIQTRLDS